jgi:predicted membrane protein
MILKCARSHHINPLLKIAGISRIFITQVDIMQMAGYLVWPGNQSLIIVEIGTSSVSDSAKVPGGRKSRVTCPCVSTGGD